MTAESIADSEERVLDTPMSLEKKPDGEPVEVGPPMDCWASLGSEEEGLVCIEESKEEGWN